MNACIIDIKTGFRKSTIGRVGHYSNKFELK